MLDLLWNKYWVNTLSSSPLLATRELLAGQLADIGGLLGGGLGCSGAVKVHCGCWPAVMPRADQ